MPTSVPVPRPKWISLKALANVCVADLFEVAHTVVIMPSPEHPELFDKDFWDAFIYCSFRTATAKPCSLEYLNSVAKKACFNITGDLRTRVAKTLYSCWQIWGFECSEDIKKRFNITTNAGFQKLMYGKGNYGIIADILLMSFQRNKACIEYGSKMLWEIFVTEWTDKQDLFDIEQEIISGLYKILFSSDHYIPGATEIQNYSSYMLQLHAVLDPEDEAYHAILDIGNIMFDLEKTSVEMLSIPVGEEFDDARTFYKLHVAGLLMNIDKPEFLQSLINEMYESNLRKNNFVQAALSLELLANTYDWNNSYYLPACKAPKFSAQSEFKRKESLFRLMATNFVKGGKIEQAIDTYNELLEAYRNYNFDLSGLSFCHGELCKSYSAMESTGRLDSAFFKVSYIGLGFPKNLRGKDFIYEGLPFEHITSINQRLARLYPGSRVISNEDEAAKLAANPPVGKYIHSKTVTPAKSLAENSNITYMTRQYIDNKNLNVFVSNRRIPGSTNICNLWTEEVTYETELTFPTLMNRSEVKNKSIVKVSPIKNAIKSLLEKNSELKGLEFLLNRNLKEGIAPKSIAGTTMFSDLSRVLAARL
ncbi:unnamed protein product [Ambrosiozyma monospora]|uniref:Unnamed protein product n=1 Tax=Ambrosiozyma monospora TaxID=43982 RepID=A0ACB5TC98_AMBMO|nr:unnamed protein product [Ambrosiozyma monospora]